MKACKSLAVVAGCLALLGEAGPARADNIWERRSPRYGFLFQDVRARNIGDVLTVFITENNSVNQREQRQLTKATDTSNDFNYAGSTSSDNGSRSGAASMTIGNQSSRNFNGNAQLTSGRVFTDRMSVTVVDVLPNGNLLVEGHRTRTISGERRVIRLSGIVRPADLSPANTILSEAMANFRLEYHGRGVDSQFTNQGWFGRVLNIAWPF